MIDEADVAIAMLIGKARGLIETDPKAAALELDLACSIIHQRAQKAVKPVNQFVLNATQTGKRWAARQYDERKDPAGESERKACPDNA